MNSETAEQHISDYHSKDLNKHLEEIRAKRSILEQTDKQDFVNKTNEEAKKRNMQILKKLSFFQERRQWIKNDCYSNSRLKIMEKNYWSFVRSMKPLWEREISSVSRNK